MRLKILLVMMVSMIVFLAVPALLYPGNEGCLVAQEDTACQQQQATNDALEQENHNLQATIAAQSTQYAAANRTPTIYYVIISPTPTNDAIDDPFQAIVTAVPGGYPTRVSLPTRMAFATGEPSPTLSPTRLPSMTPVLTMTAIDNTENSDLSGFAELTLNATDLLPVSGGTFVMGTDAKEIIAAIQSCQAQGETDCDLVAERDSYPPVTVTVANFLLEQTEVSNRQYVAFLNALLRDELNHLNGCRGYLCLQTDAEIGDQAQIRFEDNAYHVISGRDQHPVQSVTWYGAMAYCEALSRRLPTEREWERAARGDDGRLYPAGDDFDATLYRVNITVDDNTAPTVRTGSQPDNASPYGLLDMAGNVAEWVQDVYQADAYNTPETETIVSGERFVVRGGSWADNTLSARVVTRRGVYPQPERAGTVFPSGIGFRCARDVSSPVSVIAPDDDLAGQSGCVMYTVQPGDTLSSLAERIGINAQTLRDVNQLTSPFLASDQTLILPLAGCDPKRDN